MRIDPERLPLFKPTKKPLHKTRADYKWLKVRASYLAGKMLHNGRYACERCGAQVEHPHVHHVITRGARPDLKYDMLNLRLLCHVCHGNEHHQRFA